MTAKKATVKSLQQEIVFITEELNEVKSELKEVKENKEGQGNEKVLVEENGPNEISVNKCSYCQKIDLKQYLKTVHPREIKYRFCDNTFSQNLIDR